VPAHPAQRILKLRLRSPLEARQQSRPLEGKLEENGAPIRRIGAAADVFEPHQSVAERRSAGQAHIEALGEVAYADGMPRRGEDKQRAQLREREIDVRPGVWRSCCQLTHSRDESGELCLGSGHMNTLRGIDYRC
jgi:hypothetical protein